MDKMEYYTQKNKLILTEYGRNIQQMVEYAMTIEDRQERTRCVKTIINIMGNLFPHLRDVNDFKHKLWDHLAMMSNYQLDIDYPYDVPTAPPAPTAPEKIPYPQTYVKYRHYGQTIPVMIEIAKGFEGEKRDRMVTLIVNHMKKCFIAWNKDMVEDSKILDDLREMSAGVLDYPEGSLHIKDSKEFLSMLPQTSIKGKQKKNFKRKNPFA